MFWTAITFLGDYRLYAILIPIIYIAFNRKLGFKLIVIYMFSMYLNQVFKHWFMLPRPPQSLWLIEAGGYGFPSGHTQASSTFWSYLALNTKLTAIKPIAIVLPLLIAYSRLYLQVHYLIDVIGGLLLGYGLPLVAYISNTYISRRIAKLNIYIHILYAGCSLLMVYTSTILPGGYGYIPLTAGSFLGAYVGYTLSEKFKANIEKLRSKATAAIITFIVSVGGYTAVTMFIGEIVLSYIVSAVIFLTITFLIPILYLKFNL